MTGHDHPWRHAATLVAVGLEGSGPQDGDAEVIVEVAAVRLADGIPWMSTSFSTLIDPQRRIRRGPWTTAGVTDQALAIAPSLGHVTPSLMRLLADTILVGHNIGADRRLLHRHLPTLHVDGFIDTLVLARWRLGPTDAGLPATLETFGLTGRVNAAAPAGQPHRALWEAVGAAVLLEELVRRLWQREPSLAELLTAGVPADPLPDRPAQPLAVHAESELHRQLTSALQPDDRTRQTTARRATREE